MIIKQCLICSKSFGTYPKTDKKYCSRECLYISHRGFIPWNKGTKGLCKPNSGCFKKGDSRLMGNQTRKGLKLSEAHKKAIKDSILGNKNIQWKGDKVGYRGLHKWQERQLGKPNHCEFCNNDNLKPRQYHWANKSHKYLRDKKDWIRLCVKCHKKYDRK